MKLFFRLMLVFSIVSAGYTWLGYIGVFAHNHYTQRSELLDTTRRQPEFHISDGFTSAELASTDRRFASAYKLAVFDGTRLGAAFDRLQLQSLVVASCLFLSSLVGLRLSSGKERAN